MNKRLFSGLLGLCLAFAPTSGKAEDAVKADGDVTIPIPGAIDYQVLLETVDGKGLPPALWLKDTATLEKLHNEQGGMLFLDDGDFCKKYTPVSFAPWTSYFLQYGVLGAVVGKTSVNYLTPVYLDNQIKPIVNEKKGENKQLVNCSVIGTNVILQFR